MNEVTVLSPRSLGRMLNASHFFNLCCAPSLRAYTRGCNARVGSAHLPFALCPHCDLIVLAIQPDRPL